MLNYKFKFHRRISASKRNDSPYIAEIGKHIEYVFTIVVIDKTAESIFPHFLLQVSAHSIIYIYEQKAYGGLTNLGFFIIPCATKMNF